MNTSSLSAVAYERSNGQVAIHIYFPVNNSIGELTPDISNARCTPADVVATNAKQRSPITAIVHDSKQVC